MEFADATGFRLTGSAGRQHRARSADVVSMRDSKTTKKDPIENLSKIKDFDLKNSIDAKLQRLSQSLGPPRGSAADEASLNKQKRSRLLRRNLTAGDSDLERGRGHSVPPPRTVVEDFQPDNYQAVRDKFGGSLTVRRTEPPYILDKLPHTSSAVERKGQNLFSSSISSHVTLRPLEDFDRPHHHGLTQSILDQLRRETVSDRHGVSPAESLYPDNGRQPLRAELDSFAALLGKIPTPRTAVALDMVRQRDRRTPAEQGDFTTRLAHARSDLTQLEGMVGRTFNWTDLVRTHSRTVEPPGIINEVRFGSTPHDVALFITGGSDVDYSRRNTLAEQAITWAQERRLRVESELEQERRRERFQPRPLGGVDWDEEVIAPAPVRHYERQRHLVNDAALSYEVPTIVRAAYNRRDRRAETVALELESAVSKSSSQRTTRQYQRSASDTVVGQTSRYDRPSSASARRSEAPTQTSDVRRRVREVLSKYKH